MFQRIPTDAIRQVLLYLSVSDTWSLFQAYHSSRPVFYRAIRSLCLSPVRQDRKMWVPLRCDNRHYSNSFFCPGQHVPVRLQMGVACVHLSAKCSCCEKRTSFPMESVAFVRQQFCHHERLGIDTTMPGIIRMPNPPVYLSPHVFLAGYYKPLSETMLVPGRKLEALDGNCVWYPAVIMETTDTHVRIRYLGRYTDDLVPKTSPRLAKFGLRIREWDMCIGTQVDFKPSALHNWRNGTIVGHYDERGFILLDSGGREKRLVYNGCNILWDGIMTKPMGRNGYCAQHHVSFTRWHKEGLPVYMTTEGGHLRILE